MTDRLRVHLARAGHGPRRVAALVVAGSVLLAGVTGCGADGAAPVAQPDNGRQPVTVCSDPAGDGGSVDLLSITAAPGAEQVFLAFSFAAAMPAGAATLGLRSAGSDRQVEIGLRDGQPTGVVMRAGGNTATAAHPDEVVHVAGPDVHVVLPGVMMPAEAHDWSAETTAGSARDRCGTEPAV